MRGERLRRLAAATLALAVGGCASTATLRPELHRIDTSALPPADLALNIPGLGPCTDGPNRTLHLDADEPVVVLVHGCYGSAGRFRSLAQVLAFHGQQSACFSYDDRDSLTYSATELVGALDALAAHIRSRQVTVIGHSQGGLIARNALTTERERPLNADLHLRLVTVSSPYAGIAAADHCASALFRLATLGLAVPVCMLISGEKWYEITHASDFIRRPGTLSTRVGDFVKIATDEHGTCRRYGAQERCIEDDYVFSLAEQYHPPVDDAPRVVPVQVKAGHAEIVGNDGAVPHKLIAVLQNQRILRPTPPDRTAALDELLTALYQRHQRGRTTPTN